MAEILYLPAPTMLTLEQTEHWEHQLEIAERLREHALRVLGRLPIEQGLDG